ncbi:MAG: HlyD family secretion protein [Armatimonadota bacterium]
MKISFPVVFAVSIAALVVSGCGKKQADLGVPVIDGAAIIESTLETDEVDVSSKIPGRIARMTVDEGDSVKAGDLLAVLESKEVDAKLTQATGMADAADAIVQQAGLAVGLQDASGRDQVQLAAANLTAAKATLTMALHATRPEQLHQAEAAYDAAKAKLQMAMTAVRPQELRQAEAGLAAAKAQFDAAEATWNRVSSLSEDGVLPRQKEDEVRMQYLSAKAAVEAAEAKLDMAKEGARQEDIDQAKANLKASSAQLSLARKGARKEDIDKARAGVSAAEAQLRQAQDAMAQVNIRQMDQLAASSKAKAARGQVQEASSYKHETLIYAPVDGFVSTRLSDPGEMVNAGYPIITLANNHTFRVKVYADESLFAQIKLGDTVKVNLPAMGANSYDARIVRVGAAAAFAVKKATNETNSTDVKSLQIVVKLLKPDPRMRAGMTARVALPLADAGQ